MTPEVLEDFEIRLHPNLALYCTYHFLRWKGAVLTPQCDAPDSVSSFLCFCSLKTFPVEIRDLCEIKDLTNQSGLLPVLVLVIRPPWTLPFFSFISSFLSSSPIGVVRQKLSPCSRRIEQRTRNLRIVLTQCSSFFVFVHSLLSSGVSCCRL